MSDRDGNDEIYIMDANGNNQQHLTNNLSTEIHPDGHPMAHE
ncbi:MAG: hypothetical protein WBG58_15805 [Ignavibacteriaceae bacterium]